jgi:hypothetical protein
MISSSQTRATEGRVCAFLSEILPAEVTAVKSLLQLFEIHLVAD